MVGHRYLVPGIAAPTWVVVKGIDVWRLVSGRLLDTTDGDEPDG